MADNKPNPAATKTAAAATKTSEAKGADNTAAVEKVIVEGKPVKASTQVKGTSKKVKLMALHTVHTNDEFDAQVVYNRGDVFDGTENQLKELHKHRAARLATSEEVKAAKAVANGDEGVDESVELQDEADVQNYHDYKTEPGSKIELVDPKEGA